MNFGLETHQEDIQNLAKKLLSDRVTPDFLSAHETGETPGFDRGTWDAMAEVGLLGLALSEAAGGSGLGLVESCLVLQEIGRCLAPVPYLSCIVGAAAAFDSGMEGSAKTAILDGVVSGRQIVTVGLWGEGHDAPWDSGIEALTAPDGWSLNGVRERVPAAQVASRILVSARSEAGELLLFCMPLAAASISVEGQTSTEDRLLGRVHFLSTQAGSQDLVARGLKAESILRDLVDRMTVGACAMELGMAEEALRLTAWAS